MGRASGRVNSHLIGWAIPVITLAVCLGTGSRAVTSQGLMMHDGSVVISSAKGEQGVLILAHGGNMTWNENVIAAVQGLNETRPVVIHFGMGMHDASYLKEAVGTLEAAGAKEILAVPLFVSSYSSIIRQLEYLLGLRAESPFDTKLTPVTAAARISMAGALDGAEEVVEILKERIVAISEDPSLETIILVAHGPVDDGDNVRWNEMLDAMTARLKTETPYRSIRHVSLRDDAPVAVKDAAVVELRKLVQEASQTGGALVVPFLISEGGIEAKIPVHLKGLDYRFYSKGLLPHPNIQKWLARQIDQGFRS